MMAARPSNLPPTAYQGEDGRIYRDLKVFKGYETDEATGEIRELHELEPSEVYLTSATDERGIYRDQKIARSRGLDFYHPRLGWLRRGVKREVDWPENLGTLATPRRRISTPVAAPPAPEPVRVDEPADVRPRRSKENDSGA